MRTRLYGRLPRPSAPKEPRRPLPAAFKTKALPVLIVAAILTASMGLAPRLPHLQQGILLSAKLLTALPQPETPNVPASDPGSKPTPPEPEAPVSSDISEPETSEDIAEPSASEPASSEPASSEPVSSASSVSEPGISEPAVSEPEIPEENKAALVHKTYTAAPSNIFIPLEAGFIKNCTSHSSNEILAQLENPPYFTVDPGDAPQVLIMHTHTTESYLPFTGDYYDTSLPTRSTNNAKNMAAVGDVIAERLEAAGIGVLHDKTQHDHPSYNGSYDRSAVTVKGYLAQYPSIKVVLDIHRDAIISGSTVTAPVTVTDEGTAAQVMIISGCDNGNMNYPDYMKNLSFAGALQVQMETDHPGFTRPLLFDYRKYNQHLTTGSILIEVGSHGNTLEQALKSGEWIGDSLGRLLNGMRE